MNKIIRFALIPLFMVVFLSGCTFYINTTPQVSDTSSIASSSAPSAESSSFEASSGGSSSEEVISVEASSEELSSDAPESDTEEPLTVEGIFKGVEWGDYLHMSIEDDDGELHSFFVLRLAEDSADVAALEVGQRIRVEWKTSVEHLDPPGEDVEVEQVTKIILIEG